MAAAIWGLFAVSYLSLPIEGLGRFSSDQWSFTGRRPSKDDLVQVTLAIKQTNTQWFVDTLVRVSDPDSPQYGNHISLTEISRHVYGDPIAVAKVKEAFNLVGIVPKFTLGEGFAVADVPVETAELLFKAKFHEFEHNEHQGLVVVRSVDSTIPSTLTDYVDFVAGVSDFPSRFGLKPHYGTVVGGKTILADTTPKSIDKAYNINGYSATNSNNSQAIASFLGQYFSPNDLLSFQKQYNITPKPILKVVGKNDPSNPGMEASLDVQYIMSTGRNVDTWFISVGTDSNGKQEDFMSWLLELVNNSNSPWVHSASYGDYESTIDSDYMSRTEQEFMRLGISGRSLLFASGDDGTSCSLTHGGRFEPMWPASSPHITTVGGTVSMTECWDHSGGGFSNVFQTPSYQQDAVNTYLKSAKLLPNSKDFNSKGRGYPDLSVYSVNYDIVVLGIPWPVDGTSCAAPTTAGIISLLNDIRLNKGKSTLGFLNPLLYKLSGKGFFDINQGTNRGRIWCKGFTATSGWDPASGWGSPNFGALRDLVVEISD